jgi:general secretion pathway protein E
MLNLQLPSYSYAKHHGVLVTVQTDPLDTATHQTPALLVYRKRQITVATINEITRFLGCTPKFETVEDDNFERLLAAHYNDRSKNNFLEEMEDFGEDLDIASLVESLPEPQDLMEMKDDAPIIRLINALLTQAIRENASDIHIEPFEQRLSIRLRIDGVLREILQPPRNTGKLIVSRIKVMAQLDIAEKRLPQDGRISLRIAGRPVDVRVSTLPSGHGERVVMRLLDKHSGCLELDALGMATETYSAINDAITRPHGIILVTGPTGSGKTTTLYAVLNELNNSSRNILTVEDPIEYFLDGVGQTQVNTKVDMTFARGLRAILRQDPDVVMVGEIRDFETAQIAVQASLTGHMVFSTLHTNTAVGAITRLRDMGVEPFLLSSSLLGVLSQRLVRRLCSQCRSAHAVDSISYQKLLSLDPNIAPQNELQYYKSEGCSECKNSGYQGRIGIYEWIAMDETMQSMVHAIESEQTLRLHTETMSSNIRQDGVRLVLAGVTSLAEILRVTREH